MLVSLSATSQGVYPRQAVIDSDTVGILSIDQIRAINKTFVSLDECNELKDSLNSEIATYTLLTHTYKNIIGSKDTELSIYKDILKEKDSIIETDAKMIKKMKRNITWLRVQRIGLSVAVVAITLIHFL